MRQTKPAVAQLLLVVAPVYTSLETILLLTRNKMAIVQIHSIFVRLIFQRLRHRISPNEVEQT